MLRPSLIVLRYTRWWYLEILESTLKISPNFDSIEELLKSLKAVHEEEFVRTMSLPP